MISPEFCNAMNIKQYFIALQETQLVTINENTYSIDVQCICFADNRYIAVL